MRRVKLDNYELGFIKEMLWYPDTTKGLHISNAQEILLESLPKDDEGIIDGRGWVTWEYLLRTNKKVSPAHKWLYLVGRLGEKGKDLVEQGEVQYLSRKEARKKEKGWKATPTVKTIYRVKQDKDTQERLFITFYEKRIIWELLLSTYGTKHPGLPYTKKNMWMVPLLIRNRKLSKEILSLVERECKDPYFKITPPSLAYHYLSDREKFWNNAHNLYPSKGRMSNHDYFEMERVFWTNDYMNAPSDDINGNNVREIISKCIQANKKWQKKITEAVKS
jgi:hypothetical protein